MRHFKLRRDGERDESLESCARHEKRVPSDDLAKAFLAQVLSYTFHTGRDNETSRTSECNKLFVQKARR